MPVTAKLSRRFYATFGDDIANELVEWFNQVDATYRADLRELNELNFARFDSKLEQRFAESDAKWERRFAEWETKWELRFAELRAEFRVELLSQTHGLRSEILNLRSELLRWMFIFWVGSVATVLVTRLL